MMLFDELKKRLRLESQGFNYQPRYNIAPTQLIPVIINRDDIRMLTGMRWGFIPFWAKDEKIGYKMINARVETIAEKVSFKRSLQRRRCLVPARGFYELK